MVLEVSIIGPNTLKAMGLREVLNFDYEILNVALRDSELLTG
jgi:hypothetical protein